MRPAKSSHAAEAKSTTVSPPVPYYRLAERDPHQAMDLFLDAMQSMDIDRCLFPLETVRVKVFRKLGRITEFRLWLERWKLLLLEALDHSPCSHSMKHHRLLFAMALYLNDRALADRVSPEYLRGFDLDTAFPRRSVSVPAASRPVIDLAAPPRNRLDGRVRVLIHVDGDGAFLPSFVPEICCGEAMLNLLGRYGFPASVSLICQDVIIDQIEHGGTRADQIRAAYRPDLTQLASHGFIHPFGWRTETFDADREIAGAKRFLERWSGQDVGVFLYTGDCALTVEHLRQVEAAGLLGVNGQARFQQPMLRSVGDWFQLLAAGASDFTVEDYPTFCLRHFARILDGELDYPISVYVHHYSMMTRERADGLAIILEWLRAHENSLHFDSLENYYGEWRSRIVPAQPRQVQTPS